MDRFQIDGHKLIYHVSRVSDWLADKTVYPIYMEISPSGTCNHRCTYCALDFMNYQKRWLDADLLKERLSELGRLGVKSVMYAGEGEPLLHQQIGGIIRHTKNSGIDVGVTSNGVLLKKELADQILGQVEWIKISINGATADLYAKIHRTKPADFDLVIRNMSYAARCRDEQGYKCTLGMQLLLLPDNYHQAADLARLACDIGMNYLVIKPYSQHPQSKTKLYEDVKYEQYYSLADTLAGINNDKFNVIFRMNTMIKWDEQVHGYEQCQALPFWSYIDSGGNVWGCSIFLGDEKFCYGNIHTQTFREIWEGEQRKLSLKWVEENLDANQCRVGCRMDKINAYLWELKHPPEHVNFI
ncbi:MAG: radical SAM protein [Candidatus Schekmanbacteria bacterium]|nr:radical SAM protein [Candidatus Schekmanbacteria bacterium]